MKKTLTAIILLLLSINTEANQTYYVQAVHVADVIVSGAFETKTAACQDLQTKYNDSINLDPSHGTTPIGFTGISYSAGGSIVGEATGRYCEFRETANTVTAYLNLGAPPVDCTSLTGQTSTYFIEIQKIRSGTAESPISDGQCQLDIKLSQKNIQCGLLEGDFSQAPELNPTTVYCATEYTYSGAPSDGTEQTLNDPSNITRNSPTDQPTVTESITQDPSQTTTNPDGSTTTVNKETVTTTEQANDSEINALDLYKYIQDFGSQILSETTTTSTTQTSGANSTTIDNTTTTNDNGRQETIVDKTTGTITTNDTAPSTGTGTTTTTINTDSNGNTTGTTTTTTGDSATGATSGTTGKTGQGGNGENTQGTITGSATDCNSPLVCTGDAIACAALALQKQEHCESNATAQYLAQDSLLDGNNTKNTIGDIDFNVDNIVGQYDQSGFVSGTCPAPMSIDYFAGAVTVSFEPMCDLAGLISPLLIGFALFIAGRIVLRSLV